MSASRKLAAVMALHSLFSLAGWAGQRPPATAPVVEPQAVEILRRYVQVTGGGAAYERITSRELRATIEVAALKLHGTLVTRAKAPNKVMTSQVLEGMPPSETGYDGQLAWTRTAGGPAQLLEGEALRQTRAQAGFNAAANAETTYSTIRMAGVGQVDGKPVDKIELRSAFETILQSYDRETGLLVQSEQSVQTARGEQPAITAYADYRAVDGVRYPHLTRTAVGNIVLEQKVVEIKHNADFADAVFAAPKGTSTRSPAGDKGQ